MLELRPRLSHSTYYVHRVDEGVQYINGAMHQHIDTYGEILDFHVVSLRSTHVLLVIHGFLIRIPLYPLIA